MSSMDNQHLKSNEGGEQTRAESGAEELVAGFFQAGGLLNNDDDVVDDQAALRWRQALLRLSETFLDAAEERRDLSPILLGALHNALEQLLIHGNEDDLMALEEWLSHEAPPPAPIEQAVSDAARGMFSGSERRHSAGRRSHLDRRQAARRRRNGRRDSDY
jgi:hypothetical protein